ncbi:hypothetical protein C7974DRAFT_7415 [Boeremia exigua]|uniref:uncharacterized protein n=1 Tax=Boeremia exigua TaxID=749465 RepID=UPI001E8E0014|nr:uncharacterized protein C7974DRAFT_7415 [Boeremia exigua]KAH6643836.1 hypothetical protein C7974DRAFT_7415 [Boeremia exigua]
MRAMNQATPPTTIRQPYVESRIVSLDVGSSATRFLVHSWMLRKSAPLFALASNDQPVSLPKLHEGPAHTLIHHLYAGTFERKIRYAPVGKFRHSTCVYCAAVQYQLPDLAELSKDEIVQTGQGLSIFDILRVARDQTFTLLPEGDAWYSEYLEDAIKKAMAKDPEPFQRPDFITRVEGNSRLLQIVWKTVMSNYAAVSAPTTALQPLDSGAVTPIAESMATDSEVPTQDSLHQLPSPTESVVNSPITSREGDDLNETDSLDLESSASNLETSASTHPRENNLSVSSDVTSNDDFGLPAIEPTFGQSEVLKTVAAPPAKVKKAEHVRADSVVEAEAVAPDNSFDDAKQAVLNETPPTIANGTNDPVKKSKKKAKKKNSSITF